MPSLFVALYAALSLSSVSLAQSSPSVVCISGQCLQGFTNITTGAVLSEPGLPSDLLLLPGQYTSSTNPQLLAQALTASSATLSTAPGFLGASASSNTRMSLPLDLQLEPGLATYTSARYSGQPGFIPMPDNASTGPSTPQQLSAASLMLSSNTWAHLTSGSGANNASIILWDSIPDTAQFPTGLSSSVLSLLSLQSAACSPPCASGGVCSAQGSCSCAPGFTGSSCESCSPGFFGPTCQACPAECASAGACDDGIGGSGRCLTRIVANTPESCNCLNGQCGANGQCACNEGWTASANGTQCASCAPGFFLSSDGNCKVCSLGCAQCADSSSVCITCRPGFTQDANDRTQCRAPQSVTSSGQVCPDGSFSAAGASCAPCSPLCQTCTGGTSNDCVICGAGRVSFGGSCVQTDASGVCAGSSLVADNNKRECEACPAKCTLCNIPNFSVASTIDQVQCTGCLPGFVLSQGQCVDSCPSGTFLDTRDNLTCTACDASCGTCAGAADFCLTCTNNQLANAGSCTSACPSNTFSSGGACLPCHPDCATCSGGAFSQCASCPAGRPVLAGGRCLPTCSKTQFFDASSSSCQACDSSCASCSGSGPQSCLACADADSVLRAGSCVAAACANGTSVVPGLGACLSELVAIPQASGTGTGTAAPLPTLPGIDNPTVAAPTGGSRGLEWWQILLMALGCAFIALMLLLLWRRRMRKIRAQRTVLFARTKGLDAPGGWRWRLQRFGERLFGRKRAATPQLMELHLVEEARSRDGDVDKIVDAYAYSRPSHSRASSVNSRTYADKTNEPPYVERYRRDGNLDGDASVLHRLSDTSFYTQVTGQPRRGADPRQPVRYVPVGVLVTDNVSGSSASSYSRSTGSRSRRVPVPAYKAPTPAEEYAKSVMLMDTRSSEERAREPRRREYSLRPDITGNSGSSGASKNPFRAGL